MKLRDNFKIKIDIEGVNSLYVRLPRNGILKKHKQNKIKNYYVFLQRIIRQKKVWICCQLCDHNKGLYVHHIDGNHNNNKLDNLIILCKSCHIFIHFGNTASIEHKQNLQKITDKFSTVISP